jgi:hypothetical protein
MIAIGQITQIAMRKLAFIITIAGIFALFLILAFSKPLAVHNSSDLSKLTDNTKVSTTGKVISERILYGTTKLLKLDNSIELVCSSCPSYANKTIQVIGTSEKYENKTQIQVLRIISSKP